MTRIRHIEQLVTAVIDDQSKTVEIRTGQALEQALEDLLGEGYQIKTEEPDPDQ